MKCTLTPQHMVALLNLKERLNANISTDQLVELLRPDYHVGHTILNMKRQSNYTEKFQDITVFAVAKEGGFKYTTQNLGVLTPGKAFSFTTKEINEFITNHNKKRRRGD